MNPGTWPFTIATGIANDMTALSNMEMELEDFPVSNTNRTYVGYEREYSLRRDDEGRLLHQLKSKQGQGLPARCHDSQD
jgi:hypothetical protein